MRFLAIGVAALFASVALAAPPPPKLFLSPSGEPFRLGPDDPDPLKAWFDQADTKRQGYLDKSEFRADAARVFKKLDENGDGVIDGFETADYESKVVPELKQEVYGAPTPPSAEEHARGGRDSHRTGGERSGADEGETKPDAKGRRPGRGIAQLINEPEPVTGADFNLDSHITLAEWMTAADQRFDMLDTAKSGRLTLEGLRARLTSPGAQTQQRRGAPARPD
jgi:hypothetical protein